MKHFWTFFHKSLKLFEKKEGVSEILGTVLLLAISVALFSALYLLMQNVLVAEQSPTADLVGYLDENTVYIEHHGGNSLSDTISITVSIGGKKYDVEFNESFDENNNGYWDIGERIYLEEGQITQSLNIDVSVVDEKSNKAIYIGTLQEGSTNQEDGADPEEDDLRLISWWRLDENTGNSAYDSIGSNHATLDSLTWTSGINQSGLLYDDPSDALIAASSESLSITGNLSISLWIYLNDLPVDSNDMIFTYTKGGESENHNTLYELSIDSSGELFYKHEFDGGIDQELSFNAENLVKNSWYHLVIVRDTSSKQVSLYLNNQLIETVDYFSNPTGGSLADLYLGSDRPSKNRAIDGILDEIKLFSGILSTDEIEGLYSDFSENMQGIVSHWPFNENSGNTANDVEFDNDGVIHDATWMMGIDESALYFDGSNDYVEVADDDSLDPSEMTLMAWIKHDSVSDHVAIIDKRDSTADGYDLYIAPSGKGWLRINDQTLEGTSDLDDDEWHHVVGTYNGSEIKIFVDGVEENSKVIGTELIDTTNPLRIGLERNNNFDFNGLIDEVKIYNKALSPSEINQIYQSEFDSGVISIWYLDENTGSITHDSVNDNDGSINQASWTIGINESALLFDGDKDYVSIGDDDSLDLSDSGTIETWIYINNYQPYAGIVHKGNEKDFSDEAYTLQFWGNDGTIRFSLFNVEGDDDYIDSTVDLEEKQWYHLAATWNESILALYINGELDKSIENTIGSVRNTIGTLQIGSQLTEKYNNDYGYFEFEGKIDEIKLYNTALSPSEINQSFLTNSKDESGLERIIAHWTLNETSGTTASDSEGSNDGSVQGANWISGKEGNALDFDGDNNDLVTIPYNDSLALNHNYSISFWIYPTGDTVQWRTFLTRENQFTCSYIGGNKIRVHISGYANIDSGSTLSRNSWSLIVLTYENADDGNDNIMLYVNGEEDGQVGPTWGSPNNPTNPLLFGGDGSSSYFTGRIDDIIIYDKALSAAEVSTLYDKYE